MDQQAVRPTALPTDVKDDLAFELWQVFGEEQQGSSAFVTTVDGLLEKLEERGYRFIREG